MRTDPRVQGRSERSEKPPFSPLFSENNAVHANGYIAITIHYITTSPVCQHQTKISGLVCEG